MVFTVLKKKAVKRNVKKTPKGAAPGLLDLTDEEFKKLVTALPEAAQKQPPHNPYSYGTVFANSNTALRCCCGIVEIGSFWDASARTPGLDQDALNVLIAREFRAKSSGFNMIVSSTTKRTPACIVAALPKLGFAPVAADEGIHRDGTIITLWAWTRHKNGAHAV